MVNCTYCNKEIDRKVFCTPSHKVMYHKGSSHIRQAKPQVVPVQANVSRNIICLECKYVEYWHNENNTNGHPFQPDR